MRDSCPVIDILCPELYRSTGGIQFYSQILLKALREELPPWVGLRVFLRNDAPAHLPVATDPRLQLVACGGSRLGFLRFLWAVLTAQIRQRPRLLLSLHPHFAPLQWLLGRISRRPTWCAAYGIDVWNLAPGPRRWALERLTLLLPISRYTAGHLRRQLRDRCPPMEFLPPTYDNTSCHPGPRSDRLLERYGLAADQPLLFTTCRLSRADRYKNIDALIQALPELLPAFPDLRLLIGGDGDDRPRLEALARSLGLASQVTFTGWIPQAELADHYRLATVFALPSEKEGFGIVFLEAAGCGIPCLGGNRDGSVDALADGRFGCLVDPRQPLAPPLRALLERRGESLWFDPPALSAAVAEEFGFPAFRRRLAALLARVEGLPPLP